MVAHRRLHRLGQSVFETGWNCGSFDIAATKQSVSPAQASQSGKIVGVEIDHNNPCVFKKVLCDPHPPFSTPPSCCRGQHAFNTAFSSARAPCWHINGAAAEASMGSSSLSTMATKLVCCFTRTVYRWPFFGNRSIIFQRSSAVNRTAQHCSAQRLIPPRRGWTPSA